MTDNHSEVSAATWERLSLLFESAISLPRDQRASFVDAECAGDASLRAELAGLLASADDAPEFLRAFASDVLAPAFAAATVDRSATDRSSAMPSSCLRNWPQCSMAPS